MLLTLLYFSNVFSSKKDIFKKAIFSIDLDDLNAEIALLRIRATYILLESLLENKNSAWSNYLINKSPICDDFKKFLNMELNEEQVNYAMENLKIISSLILKFQIKKKSRKSAYQSKENFHKQILDKLKIFKDFINSIPNVKKAFEAIENGVTKIYALYETSSKKDSFSFERYLDIFPTLNEEQLQKYECNQRLEESSDGKTTSHIDGKDNIDKPGESN
ncbi:hypothetical protein H312_03605 [Anncaliia algerae PRA339]|uniref:Uncharacterized protein n=1 Tax=Anncaliia algerae PRA339 TaxID=1288291 RepID=A0A059EVX1_9MICR|nr:hypothetical protein H312_03605 [Anncaliia algerae PRA339]